MPSVEALIVAIWIASITTILGGTAGTLYQFAHNPRRVPLRARYRRGRHHATPPLWARLVAAYLAGAREMATASALLRGVSL